MRIRFNLASCPFVDQGPTLKRIRIAMGVIAVVAIALGYAMHVFHQKAIDTSARVQSLDAEIALVTREREGYRAMMRAPENAQLLRRAKSLNILFYEKTFSWTLAMEDLESVLPSGVQVTSIEPSRDKDGQISLRLRVLGPLDRGVELVQNLERSNHFFLPRIARETAEAKQGSSAKMELVSDAELIEFDLLTEYSPASLRGATPLIEAAASVKAPAGVRVVGPVLEPHSGPSAAISKSTVPLHRPNGGRP